MLTNDQEELLVVRRQQFLSYELTLEEFQSFVRGLPLNATDSFITVQEAAKDRYKQALEWVRSDRPTNTVFHSQ